ncbi:alpha/beta fold hydrolase [Variovorax sp. JS1663]|uniref:alpha/beta fold hydrolase n=1 Tax=Variovorax sp. JS1663 TaxID=1851577 RepID=UPI000B348BCD|nr:alpha/beta hydrolase [Variovorax sp. JS1663]OUM02118.1 hypothetical protein A8M77_12055 [Variovorax sp. JS1663]
MKSFRASVRLAAAMAACAIACVVPTWAAAQAAAKTVVLVHGAFADGSSWHKVIPLLKKTGLSVVAVQHPLDSLENDVAFTTRALDIAQGPVVLVGHSYGGVVITEAGVHDKVKSLVYIAAHMPDAGESLTDVARNYPPAAGRPFIQADSKGFLKISDEGVFKHFAADLPRAEQELVAATQGPFHSKATTQAVTKAAWKSRPAYVLVAGNDTIIPPQMQRDRAKLIQATTVEVPSSHVAMLSQPEAVARLILQAAK